MENNRPENSLYGESPKEPELSHLTLKQLHSEAQPREKALSKGIGALTLSELWAIILRVGSKGMNVLELADELLRRNDYKLRRLERRSLKELMMLKGLGETKAIQVMAVMELIRRYSTEALPEKTRFTSSELVYRRMLPYIGNIDHEEIWALMLDNSHAELASICLSSGGKKQTVFDLTVLLKHALIEGATSVILCHNHPSGQLIPSLSDDSITRLCKEGCRAVGLKLLDHVIITSVGFYSYADNGRL